MSFLALWRDRSYNLQVIICFVMLFLSFLPYLWHGEGQGQACSEFRYCFTAWHFSLSAIKDWHFLNPFQNGTQSYYFLRSRIILSSVPATGNWIKLFVYELIFELAGSADWRKQNTCFPAGAEHSDSTKLLFPDLAFPTVEIVSVGKTKLKGYIQHLGQNVMMLIMPLNLLGIMSRFWTRTARSVTF